MGIRLLLAKFQEDVIFHRSHANEEGNVTTRKRATSSLSLLKSHRLPRTEHPEEQESQDTPPPAPVSPHHISLNIFGLVGKIVL